MPLMCTLRCVCVYAVQYRSAGDSVYAKVATLKIAAQANNPHSVLADNMCME